MLLRCPTTDAVLRNAVACNPLFDDEDRVNINNEPSEIYFALAMECLGAGPEPRLRR